ncbi:MAG: hypothetical protein ACXADC_13510 [Candidatus Thorarchaeota archaeon]|jgi:hypothetical protein
MGDVFLNYDEAGRAYFRRLVYCNILFYLMLAFAVVFIMVDIIIVIIAGLLVAIASLLYAFYFIQKNPPTGSTNSIDGKIA